MNTTIFLYLDLLGFRELAETPDRVHRVFEALDSANIHNDSNYRAIVFSDTLIAYNSVGELSDSHKRTEVMFLIELVHDITHLLTGSGVTFRAIIASGEFEYSRLENIDAYFGSALIDTYDAESSLPGIGLYLTDEIASLDNVFQSVPCGSGMNFSFLAYDLVREADKGETFPMHELSTMWAEASIEPRILNQIEYLRMLYEGLAHPSAKVRSKYASAWGMYLERIPELVSTLRGSGFAPDSLCDIDWTSASDSLNERKRFFSH